MKRLTLVVLALAALACSRQPPGETAKTADPPRKEQTPANSVTIEPAAQKEAGVGVEKVQLRSLPQVVRTTARLVQDENQTWRVGAIAEGRVVRVLANPGDAVAQGQVLARLHSHDIHEARADFRKSVAELARLSAGRDSAQRIRDRAKRLFELKAGSLEQVELAETELRNAATAASNEQIEVDRARSHLVEFLGVAAEDASPKHNDDDDYIPVRSPAAGTVLTRSVTPGTVVTPANDMFVVSDLSKLWAMAEVNEEHLKRLRPGMAARIYVQAYGDEAFAGRIGKLGEALDPATRTVKVRVELPNRGGRLKPEMYAACEIELGGSDSALFVPQEAVQEVRGQNVVFALAAPNRFELRPVETGRSLRGAVEILRGIQAGETVAARGTFILKSEFLKASLAEE